VPRLPVDPRHGTHDPTRGTPARVAGSVRRTTSVDMLRPDGPDGQLVLIGVGRDLVTAVDGAPSVVDTGRFEATVDYADAQRVVALTSTPAIDGLDALIGRSASTGFRAALIEVVADQDFVGRPVYQLLDDLPVATLISGYSPQQAMAADGAWRDASARNLQRRRPEGLELIQQADLCAGWKTGGTIMDGMAQGLPPVVTGPDAPSLAPDHDPWAWHDLPGDLPAGAMRRRRRIDVCPGADDAPVVVDAMFRDSHVDDEGNETIVHEYTVLTHVDRSEWRVISAHATPRVLPWFECPEAAASATRLAGDPLAGLRARVRADFVGITTCTHLNDALRALEDVPVLARAL
jgi:Protein of unknown function (DUF2889)